MSMRPRFSLRPALLLVPALLLPRLSEAQATVSGYVRTLAGDPIAGATVKLVTLNQTRTTDAKGFYNFGGPASLGGRPSPLQGVSARGDRLDLRLEGEARVSVGVYDLSGRLVRSLADRVLPGGTHAVPLGLPSGARQLWLLKAQVDDQVSWFKLAALDGRISVSGHDGAVPDALAKAAASAPDSINVTHPGYDGGLVGLNGRRVAATTGVQNFRLVSTSKEWDVAVPQQITWGFTHAAGSARFKQLVPDWNATMRKVMYEVVQSIWRTPEEIPASKRHTRYTVNFPDCGGVASASGTTINFCGPYVARQANSRAGWLEVLGVLIHESMHTYQPYYNATGASGFGEAVPDAVRALTGYFSFYKTGSKCSGGYAAAYQGGGRYWLYIELKHPGFINRVYKITSGDIAARVQQATGESLSTLSSECQSKGMPEGSG